MDGIGTYLKRNLGELLDERLFGLRGVDSHSMLLLQLLCEVVDSRVLLIDVTVHIREVDSGLVHGDSMAVLLPMGTEPNELRLMILLADMEFGLRELGS